MSNPIPTIEGALDGVETPFCLTGEVDPRHYLAGVGQWPSFAFKGLAGLMSAALKKKVAALMTERAEQREIQAKNDVADCRRRMIESYRDGSDAGAFQGEALAREIRGMDLEAHSAATQRLREIAQEAQQLAADFCLVAAEGMLPLFIEECKTAEARLTRHNRPLSENKSIEGYPCTKWALHEDEILGGIFADMHFLKFYWGGPDGQLLKPTYDSRTGLDWLNDCLKN
jgi:hypothetical protein